MTQMTLARPWVFRQLTKLHDQHPELVDNALTRLMADEPDLRWSLVINAYRDGEISLAKAAELLGLHSLQLRDRFIELGIPIYLGPANLSEAKAEVDAIDAWFAVKETAEGVKP